MSGTLVGIGKQHDCDKECREKDILTIPLYMGFLVEDKLADVIIPDVDVSLFNVNMNTGMK